MQTPKKAPPGRSAGKAGDKKKGINKVDLIRSIDGMPSRPGPQQGGMGVMPYAPPPFPFPANQLDRTPAGVPNLTDMILRSFQPAQPQMGAPQQMPQQAAAQTTTPPNQNGRPMAAPPGGPRPARGFSGGGGASVSPGLGR